jgi:ATP-dependent DNA helicase UvrD/PcrA
MAPVTDAEILAGLDPEQAEAVRAVRGPVCILAGAGTGKTRTITHRIAYAVHTEVVPASQLLAVTFTSRAAGEMRGRLRALGAASVQARTFHSAALRQLRYFAPRVLGGPLPEILEQKWRVVAQAASMCRLTADVPLRRDLMSEIEWAKASLVPPDSYPDLATKADRSPPVDATRMVAVYRAYEEVKRRAGMLDFEDLLLITAAAIEEHRDVAEEIRARYRHFVVDEYQDVNPLQQRLLEAWLGGRDDICVVGDANQTIYSFTGATPDYLLDFRRRYPGAVEVRLERDYRSTPQVVELANRLISGARRYSHARLRLVGQRADGPEPVLVEYDDEPAEAAAVAASCAQLVAAGVPAAEIAVLFRVNAQSEQYEAALSAAGVPYVVRGAERFFERPEVRQALMLLRGAARSAGDDDPLVDTVRDVLSAAGWDPTAPPTGSAARERWESLSALVQLATEQDPTAGLVDFCAELEARAAAQHVPTLQGVTLASLHAAKGLEWDVVFCVGLTEGTVPIQHASTDEQVEEERRLLYVGVTRARERLTLSWALSRAAGGRRTRRRSRFLAGLGGAADDRPASRPPARRAASAMCTECGAPLRKGAERALGRCADCPGDVDVALLERLRSWRAERAAAQKVPAYVILTDATLLSIAEARPSGVPDLVRLPGIGQRKLDLYGPDVLAIVADKSAS